MTSPDNLSVRTARPLAADRACPDWCLSPFRHVGDGAAVLAPRTESTFDCPMTGRPVRWESDHVFNPAAVVRDGAVHLLYRAEDDSGHGIGKHTSRVGLAVSRDGVHFERRPAPVLFPGGDDQSATESPGGCEDPRVVETDDGIYVMTYTQWDRKVARLAVATSRDLVRWKKHGPAFARSQGGRFLGRWSKSGAIVCRREGDRLIATRINGSYWMYWGEGRMYLARSDDLIEWEILLDAAPAGEMAQPRVIAAPRPGHFDSHLVEPGPPPLLTDAGILMIYNGKNAVANGDATLAPKAYSVGQMMFDAADPTRILARTDCDVFRPSQPHEVTGQYVAGTTFVEGLVPFGGRWLLYYGAADSVVGVAACERMI